VVLDHLVEEVGRRQPLALQPPLHVGDREQDGVDAAGPHLLPQFVKREQARRSGAVHHG
jgi:hypothetical protein